MTHRHHHHGLGDDDSGGSAVVVEARITRLIWPLVIACGVLTLVGLIMLWPSGSSDFEDPLQLDADPVPAEVVAVELGPCSFSPVDRCRQVRFELADGPHKGEIGTIEETPDGRLTLDTGAKIEVIAFTDVSGDSVYTFYDYQRDRPLLVLAAMFAIAVVVLGRWRGVGALGGLAASLLVIVWFTLPAILDGSNAVLVAVVTAAAIAFVALFLAHGFDISTAVALISTLASLGLTAILASVFVGASHLTGVADDSSVLLSGLGAGIDARGILLAGIVIGALGVLDDVTVTQVSAVWQLKSVRPELTAPELVKSAMRIGRDHISSTVNTLLLAYAGTSLPLLLLFVEANQGVSNVITREVVAAEIVRTLVGSLGLVASVPIATWLAATVVAPSDSILASLATDESTPAG